MGIAVSKYSDISNNELLARFCSNEVICPNDPFWNQLLAFNIQIPNDADEQLMFDTCSEPLLQKFLQNNQQTGNLGSLVQVFITRATELLAAPNSDNVMLAWQSYNALFVIRAVTKYLVEMVPEYELCIHLDVQARTVNADWSKTYKMPADFYKIGVIHYINPHLIWIEIKESSVQEKKGVLFEQIGVDGVLPMDKTISLEPGVNMEIKSEKCEDWIPAANVVMRNLFERSEEVWFSPIHIDRSPSIFDENIHKYGEILIKTNGKLKKLSKQLVASGFAYYDECDFYKKLSCGRLKTKLSTSQTQNVIKELENYYMRTDKPVNENWKKFLEKQTFVSKAWLEFEQSLTDSHLEKHRNETVKTILKNKHKVYELCKGVDLPSVGRACTRKTKFTETTLDSDKQFTISQFLARKLAFHKYLMSISTGSKDCKT